MPIDITRWAKPLLSMAPPVVLDAYAYFTFEDMQGIMKYDRESIILSTMTLPLDVEEEGEEGEDCCCRWKVCICLAD